MHRPAAISTLGVSRPPMAALRARHLGRHKVYLIRGDEVWLYDGVTHTMDAGYPRTVNDVWSGLPSGIIAAEMLTNGESNETGESVTT